MGTAEQIVGRMLYRGVDRDSVRSMQRPYLQYFKAISAQLGRKLLRLIPDVLRYGWSTVRGLDAIGRL